MKRTLGVFLLCLLLVGLIGCPKKPSVTQAKLDAENAIASASKAISAAQEVGADTVIAESILEWARKAFADGDYSSAASRARNAELSADEARRKL